MLLRRRVAPSRPMTAGVNCLKIAPIPISARLIAILYSCATQLNGIIPINSFLKLKLVEVPLRAYDKAQRTVSRRRWVVRREPPRGAIRRMRFLPASPATSIIESIVTTGHSGQAHRDEPNNKIKNKNLKLIQKLGVSDVQVQKLA